MFIKSIGQRHGSMNQRRDPIGHLIEHAAHGDVHVGRGDQQDVFVSTTFLVLNGNQSRGLQIPQPQLIEDCQVAILHGAEEFPAMGFSKTGHGLATCGDLSEVQGVGRQFAMLSLQQGAELHPVGIVVVAGELRNEGATRIRANVLERLHPGQSLDQVGGKRAFGFVEQFGQLPDGTQMGW